MLDKTELIGMTTSIVSAYLRNNPAQPSDIPGLIQDTFTALVDVNASSAEAGQQKLVPAVPIDESVTEDFIVCLEDGKHFKSLKRHLRTHYNLTPDEYREKWGLSRDYPMVAPNYAKTRSKLAKQMGLGKDGRN